MTLYIDENNALRIHRKVPDDAKEPDLILAAEKYAEMYDGDDRQDVKTDVLNAFYHGAYWREMNEI